MGENADVPYKSLCANYILCYWNLLVSFYTGRYLKIIEGNATLKEIFMPVCIIKAICGSNTSSVRE